MTAPASYLDRTPKGAPLELLTPEGVPLRFTVARPGDRIWGFFVDVVLIVLCVLVLALVFYFLRGAGGWLAAVFIVILFLVRNFYFVYFEIRWQGKTPGKRAARTRVIDRRGRPLTGRQIFVRNVTRELEVVIPIAVVANPEALVPGGPGLGALIAVLWLVAMLVLPLLNREHLRVGDLLAGTVVVKDPRAVLLADLAEAPRRGRTGAEAYPFTREQLDIYGIYELQVLEDFLRGPSRNDRNALRVISGKIAKKIGWSGPVEPRRFLEEFYAAQRGRLEKEMLLGTRREKKRR